MRRALLTRLLEKVDRVLLVVKQRRRKAELADLERGLEPAIAQAFKAQGSAFVDNLGKLQDKATDAWDEKDWLPLLRRAQHETAPLFLEPWKAIAGEAMIQGAKLTAGELGIRLVSEPGPAEIAIAFGLKNPRAVDYLQRYGAELITHIDETTRDIIRGILVKGVSEGQSYDQMAQAIIDQFAEFAEGRPQEHIDSRAHLVAITEAGNSYAYGNYCTGEELKEQGLTMEKAWSTMGDDRVSDGCRENEAADWIPFDDEFPSGHLRPLRFPGCRCDMLMRVVH